MKVAQQFIAGEVGQRCAFKHVNPPLQWWLLSLVLSPSGDNFKLMRLRMLFGEETKAFRTWPPSFR
jgi:hypothetical protein